jgi:molybdenum cofactor synthesis domain-containing protein
MAGTTGGESLRTAFILIIGDEILSGEVVDENAAHIARKLTGLGVRVIGVRVVPDQMAAIVGALGEATAEAEFVFATGGIGPTHDDLTRQAVAEACGVPCKRHAEAEQRLRQGYGTAITESELEMADLPEGSRLFYGSRTGAFGFGVDQVYVLPGIPALFRDIFDNLVEDWEVSDYFRDEMITHLREGHVADGLRAIQTEHPGVMIGSYPIKTEDGYRLRIVLRARDRRALARARERVDTLVEEGVGLVGVPRATGGEGGQAPNPRGGSPPPS